MLTMMMLQKRIGLYGNTTLTQDLQLNGFINAPLKCFVGSLRSVKGNLEQKNQPKCRDYLTSDFHAVHVLCDVELHLRGRDFAAPQARLVRDSTLAH